MEIYSFLILQLTSEQTGCAHQLHYDRTPYQECAHLCGEGQGWQEICNDLNHQEGEKPTDAQHRPLIAPFARFCIL